MERCDAPADFLFHRTKARAVAKAKVLLGHDPLAIPLPDAVADAFDLADLIRLLERAVAVAVLHDLLGDLAADAREGHQRLHVRGVDVDLRVRVSLGLLRAADADGMIPVGMLAR